MELDFCKNYLIIDYISFILIFIAIFILGYFTRIYTFKKDTYGQSMLQKNVEIDLLEAKLELLNIQLLKSELRTNN